MAKRVILKDKETKEVLYPRTVVASVEGLEEALVEKVSKTGNETIDGIKEFSMGFHVQLGGIQLTDYHTNLEDYLDEYYLLKSDVEGEYYPE